MLPKSFDWIFSYIIALLNRHTAFPPFPSGGGRFRQENHGQLFHGCHPLSSMKCVIARPDPYGSFLMFGSVLPHQEVTQIPILSRL